MKYVKLFEEFVNEAFGNLNFEVEILDLLRGMDSNGGNLKKALDSEEFEESKAELEYEGTTDKFMDYIKGGKLLKDVTILPAEFDTESWDEVPTKKEAEDFVEDMKKKGYKTWGDINIDGYIAVLFSKKPMKLSGWNLNRKLDDFIDNYYGYYGRNLE